jgi:hypothetical protein
MPKVMIQAFHDDGMKLFEARPSVTYEMIEGTLEELAEKIAAADRVTIRLLIGPEKPSNSAVFRGWLCTLDWRRRLGITLWRPAFSAAVHLAHSVPTSLLTNRSKA